MIAVLGRAALALLPTCPALFFRSNASTGGGQASLAVRAGNLGSGRLGSGALDGRR